MTAPTTITPSQTVGHWQIISVAGRKALCRCRCGKINEVSVASLEDNSSVSCGCSPLSQPKNNPKQKPLRIPDWRPQR
jgi:hypothetical protein